jgi:CRISPR/Cas system CMR-associated protein Cmr1 (group 7 of RAMP superfamily)
MLDQYGRVYRLLKHFDGKKYKRGRCHLRPWLSFFHTTTMSLCNQHNGLRTTAKNLRKYKRKVEDIRINALTTAQQNEITATEGTERRKFCAFTNPLKNMSENVGRRESAWRKNVVLPDCIQTAEGIIQPACSDNEDKKMWTANTQLGNDIQSNQYVEDICVYDYT